MTDKAPQKLLEGEQAQVGEKREQDSLRAALEVAKARLDEATNWHQYETEHDEDGWCCQREKGLRDEVMALEMAMPAQGSSSSEQRATAPCAAAQTVREFIQWAVEQISTDEAAACAEQATDALGEILGAGSSGIASAGAKRESTD